MNANPKSTEDPPGRPAGAKTTSPEIPPALAFANLFHRGIVRYAEMQKTALDQLVQHNADLQTTWKQAYKETPAPASTVLDLAVEGIERFVEAQKSLVDLTVEQSALVMDVSKERAEGTAKTVANISEIVTQSTDKLVAAEKVVLDFAAKQNTMVIDRIKRQFGAADTSPAAVAADAIRRSMDVVVQTQKEMIDLATKPIKAAAAAAGPKAASA
jgi:hypothetical protein